MFRKHILLIALIFCAFLIYIFLSYDNHELKNSDHLELIEEKSLTDLFSDNSNPVEADLGEYNTNLAVNVKSSNRFILDSSIPPDNVGPAILERLAVFGIIVDDNNQPIDDVFISDEINAYGTRSDANGQYRIIVDLPRFKPYLLNFLRSGYKSQRINISTENFNNEISMELNVVLVEDADTTSFAGWIGNDIGAGLPDREIKLTSKGGLGLGAVFYVVRSDDKGDFWFEGIRSGLAYKLEVNPSPGYSGFVIHVLNVTQFTPRLKIVLDRFELIDIRGMVVNSEAEPVPGFNMLVENISTNFPVQTIFTDSSGFYKLDNFPKGEIKFSTLAPEYFRISGITLDESTAQNLVLVVDKGSYYLSGWVSDQNGVPLENARVTIDTNFVDGEIKSYSYRSKHTDNAGTFNFADLGHNSHLITVYAQGFDKTEIMHSFSSPTDDIHIVVPANK